MTLGCDYIMNQGETLKDTGDIQGKGEDYTI
jgi:hypothetical protein